MMNVKNMEVGLSPPYGDCTYLGEYASEQISFSPPYGDGTNAKNRTQKRGVFAPLRGLYPKYITKHRKTEEPDG